MSEGDMSPFHWSMTETALKRRRTAAKELCNAVDENAHEMLITVIIMYNKVYLKHKAKLGLL